MATCKECVHENVCVIKAMPSAFENTKWDKEPCDHFKNRAHYIELPCKMGDKLYIIVTKRPRVYCEKFSFIKQSRLTYCNLERVLKDFGKTVFLTYEDAERALQ